MTSMFASTMDDLTEMQRKAVEWDDGPLLVLAGPGSGKTRVLTCRVARLINSSPDKRFRILALTFTNKAANEMRNRVASMVPDLEDRAEITTIHGFCAQLLRQHGSHLGLRPNFEIYSQGTDREAFLEDALSRNGKAKKTTDFRLIPHIDALKSRLINPSETMEYLQHDMPCEKAEHIALAYKLYEEELKRSNALDFNSLILHAFELLKYPSISKHYRTVYRYWLFDEFQDTSDSHYRLFQHMAGDDFKRLFAVADDDQTIYEWNGANVNRINNLVSDFGCKVIQLTDNFRCPPRIVEIANKLVVYNVRRNPSKHLAESAIPNSHCRDHTDELTCREYSNDIQEASQIAFEIANLQIGDRKKTAVLARNRALLDSVQVELEKQNVDAILLYRKAEFSSPEMQWLHAFLKQINRPLDDRNIVMLNETFYRFTDERVNMENLKLHSESGLVTLLSAWIDGIQNTSLSASTENVIEILLNSSSSNMDTLEVVHQVMECFRKKEMNVDLENDISALERIHREIKRNSKPKLALGQYLQELELHSKEPAPKDGAVILVTIHGAKGLEFDRVYLIGLAEEVFPSWHSVKNCNANAKVEEERRACFVAITRTRKSLILSRAKSYNNYPKEPSRFLFEMELL